MADRLCKKGEAGRSMKELAGYIRMNKKGMKGMLLWIGIFLAVFLLSGLPVAAVGYGLLLFVAVAGGGILLDFRRYVARRVRLAEEKKSVGISLEQLLAWDPDVIVVNGEPKASLSGSAAAEGILEDPDFSALTAVQNGAVYGTPNAPFSWIERPPGPNRIIGVRWLAGLLYPGAVDYDVDDEVREFFRLFYHAQLSDAQLEKLYRGEISE